jgi:hypothetical protein
LSSTTPKVSAVKHVLLRLTYFAEDFAPDSPEATLFQISQAIASVTSSLRSEPFELDAFSQYAFVRSLRTYFRRGLVSMLSNAKKVVELADAGKEKYR